MAFARGTLSARAIDETRAIANRENSLEYVRRLYSLSAEFALEEGRPADALEPLEQGLALSARSGIQPTREQSLTARALAELGRRPEAAAAVEELLAAEDSEQLFLVRGHLAQACLALGQTDAARELALQAYRDAWADGPPYSFWWEQQQAKKLLARLAVAEPALPTFDPAKVEPIPHERGILAAIGKLERGKASAT